MYLNQFSVRIPEGTERNGYVELDHNQRYTLILRNARGVRCNATVHIDGDSIGTFRIDAFSNITLERSEMNDGYFSFVDLNSREAQLGGLKDNADLGLVTVEFVPEVQWCQTGQIKGIEREELTSGRPIYRGATPKGLTANYSRAGGTVATGHSKQKFVNAERIVPDYAQKTTIHLRLILREAIPVVRPLTQRENPVPPRID